LPIFGWLGPVELLVQILLYAAVSALLIRIFNSFAAWFISLFTAISLMMQVDASNFSAMLFYAVYTTLAVHRRNARHRAWRRESPAGDPSGRERRAGRKMGQSPRGQLERVRRKCARLRSSNAL
jgi:hypothetical protein